MRALIEQIAAEIAAAGGRAYYVGGCVRDELRGEPGLDLDVEVYGLPLETLRDLLVRHADVREVGRAFGVLKTFFERGDVDFSLPRRESLTGKGHRGFTVDLDPAITREEACARRDFTVNAMMMDVLTGELLDYYGGRADLEAGRLRHVGPAFIEDPLRAYRLMQFAGRLDMTAAPDTLALCRTLPLDELPAERIFAEFEKLLLLAEKPSRGLTVALEAGILKQHPELAALVGCPQDPTWHPEGDVWAHTLMVVDAAAALRTGDAKADLALMFGALCHDLGKPATTHTKGGRIVSPGHAAEGVEPTRRFMGRISQDAELLEAVLDFVRYHLRPAEFYRVRHEIGAASIRRLALQVNIEDLVRVARADHLGRTTPDALAGEFPAGEWLLAKAAELDVQERGPAPILLGRHLLTRGYAPGPELGEKLREAFEAQLEGAFDDIEGALRWLEDA